jgi:hypothetical protein
LNMSSKTRWEALSDYRSGLIGVLCLSGGRIDKGPAA